MAESPRMAVTVAAIVERNARFLLVEEQCIDGIVFNQPAGHLETGETLLDAVRRETLEESAWHIDPVALVGVYQWQHPSTGITIVRFAFAARALRHEPTLTLDTEIIATHWLTPEELRNRPLRSPLVTRSLDDYLAGRRFPLEALTCIVPEADTVNQR